MEKRNCEINLALKNHYTLSSGPIMCSRFILSYIKQQNGKHPSDIIFSNLWKR